MAVDTGHEDDTSEAVDVSQMRELAQRFARERFCPDDDDRADVRVHEHAQCELRVSRLPRVGWADAELAVDVGDQFVEPGVGERLDDERVAEQRIAVTQRVHDVRVELVVVDRRDHAPLPAGFQ